MQRCGCNSCRAGLRCTECRPHQGRLRWAIGCREAAAAAILVDRAAMDQPQDGPACHFLLGQGSILQQGKRHRLPTSVAVGRGVKGLAAPDGAEGLEQADARGGLRDQHQIHSACRWHGAKHVKPSHPAAQSKSMWTKESATAPRRNQEADSPAMPATVSALMMPVWARCRATRELLQAVSVLMHGPCTQPDIRRT